MELLEEICKCVIDGDIEAVPGLVNQAMEASIQAEVVQNNALIPAMDEVGQLFEDQKFFVPEMLVAARAMQAGLDILKPILAESGVEPIGKIAMGTVKGDLHDIGKSLVGMMMEGAGIVVVDLGVDVPAEKFVAAAQDGVDLIGMSALLTTTMGSMKDVILALEESDVRNRVKVLIGGAPVTPDFAESIGADGYAPNAGRAVSVAKEFLRS